jgi:hypothetical protein
MPKKIEGLEIILFIFSKSFFSSSHNESTINKLVCVYIIVVKHGLT